MAKEAFKLHRSIDPAKISNWSNEAQVYPGYSMSWSNPGDVSIQGKTWKSDVSLTMSGDPTSSTNARIMLNTGANHDCNALWSTPKEYISERLVRGVYFKNYTNQAKFRPRISGVALQYKNLSGGTKYVGLGYRGTYYTLKSTENLGYEGGTSTNDFYGVANLNTTDGNVFDDINYMLSGVLFHFETTWKSGSAVDCSVWINTLRFITQSNVQHASIYYNEKYRIWGVRGK